MNCVLNLFKDDGTIVENRYLTYKDVHFDYAQISLLGDHAENTQDGNVMLVSYCDLEFVLEYKWYLTRSGYPGTYGSVDGSLKFPRPVSLHQFLHPHTPYGHVVDHINRNKLDNRRNNLRVCTALQNSYNKSKPKGSSKRFKGVTKVGGKKNPTFIASITKDGIKHDIKDIKTEEQAAKVYDMMAEELFGEYAGKNFSAIK